jgi:hypothetical protein
MMQKNDEQITELFSKSEDFVEGTLKWKIDLKTVSENTILYSILQSAGGILILLTKEHVIQFYHQSAWSGANMATLDASGLDGMRTIIVTWSLYSRELCIFVGRSGEVEREIVLPMK